MGDYFGRLIWMMNIQNTEAGGNFLYPASYSNKFTRSWSVGKYIYFLINGRIIKVLNVSRPASILVPTRLKTSLPMSPCLSHGLRRMVFQSQKLREEVLSLGYRKYYELASPFMKAKPGTYRNVEYLDIKSFYYTIHQQIYPYFNPKGVSDMKLSEIALAKYDEVRKGYDATQFITSLFQEQKRENTLLNKIVEQIASTSYNDTLDKTMVKKAGIS